MRKKPVASSTSNRRHFHARRGMNFFPLLTQQQHWRKRIPEKRHQRKPPRSREHQRRQQSDIVFPSERDEANNMASMFQLLDSSSHDDAAAPRPRLVFIDRGGTRETRDPVVERYDVVQTTEAYFRQIERNCPKQVLDGILDRLHP